MNNLKQPDLSASRGKGKNSVPPRLGDESEFLRRLLGNLEKGTPESLEAAKDAARNRLNFICVRTQRK